MESFKDKTMKGKKMLPVGTKVFDILFGHGEVTETLFYDERTSRIRVLFKDFEDMTYNQDGKYGNHHKNPTLSLTEYTLEKGGFTPISEYWNKPKVGDWGYFWDNSNDIVEFGQIYSIMDFYHTKTSAYKNFCHEIPEHIKEQMQQ